MSEDKHKPTQTTMDKKFYDALCEEIRSAEKTLTDLGNAADIAATGSAEQMVGNAWNATLDKAFDLISEFKAAHGICLDD